jgi:small subunit ribosomal protein S16
MLTIRFYPTGRKHKKTYRIVAAQKTKHVSKKFHEILGWYNPHTKDANLNKDRINHYLKLNTELSESVKSLLKKHALVK